MKMNLAEPPLAAKQHQVRFEQKLQAEILRQGPLPFWRFMEQALYAPGFGYYAAGAQKFGKAGDFITAPELHPIFAKTLVQAFLPTLQTLPQKNILEFGAGSGQLAIDILKSLEKKGLSLDHYFILEISPELAERQKSALQTALPHLAARVVWLTALPEKFYGIMLANEVLDAMPVHVFHYQADRFLEYAVTVDEGAFKLITAAPSPELSSALARIQPYLHASKHYQSEISTFIPGFIHSLAASLDQGLILLLDYGFPRAEYYHPDRHMGTLMCHYQHQAHTDPLILLGLQDITAHVDFTLVAETADAAGLDILGFQSQAGFLLEAGIADLLASFPPAENLAAKAALKTLTLPHEMGELFKVMALGRGIAPPRGFDQDRLHIL